MAILGVARWSIFDKRKHIEIRWFLTDVRQRSIARFATQHWPTGWRSDGPRTRCNRFATPANAIPAMRWGWRECALLIAKGYQGKSSPLNPPNS